MELVVWIVEEIIFETLPGIIVFVISRVDLPSHPTFDTKLLGENIDNFDLTFLSSSETGEKLGDLFGVVDLHVCISASSRILFPKCFASSRILVTSKSSKSCGLSIVRFVCFSTESKICSSPQLTNNKI